MKIATWNVNGIRAREQQFIDWEHEERPDIVCLQEIKAAIEQVPASLCELEGYWCCWHGSKGYSGVGLHVRKSFCPDPPEFGHPDFDFEGRVATTQVGNVLVASVYVPNGGKDYDAKVRFLNALESFVAARHAQGLEVVVCGDINVTRTEMDVHPRERKPVIGQLPEERELFGRMLAQGLVDVGRAVDPDNDRLFTWWAPWRNMRQRNIGWRLDYILASTSLAVRVRECRVLPEIGTSDHAPVVAVFDPTT